MNRRGKAVKTGALQYSVVVPIFNDGALARDFCREIARTFRGYLGHDDLARDVEVIFVDDGSSNDSPRMLKQVCDEFAFAKMLVLSRNFGQHIAISAGYRASSGAWVAALNVDQEDPPHQLPLLLDAVKAGDHDIVVGLYKRRAMRLSSRVTSYLFHSAMNRFTGNKTPINMSMMRVMTRRAVDAYNGLSEKSRYLPGLENWLGLRCGWVDIEHQSRRAGSSSYNFRRRVRFAIASIISFSDFPLRLAAKFGLVMAMIGGLLGTAIVADKLFFRTLLPGYASTIAVIVFLGGVQIMIIGVASLYIGRILAEVQQRPLFVIRETYGGPLQLLDEPLLRLPETKAPVAALEAPRSDNASA
ncbi:MAG: glycosyltransferase family 2 protein [Myxococcales bacterium]|nr:glycosyltransferase family 2 protein [Myxococcales bacterium]